MITRVERNSFLYAIILRHGYQNDGIEFFTPSDFSQQLGYMKRPEGYVIPPHLHNHIDRNVRLTSEVLYIKSGKVRVDFFDEEQTYFESHLLEHGDVILLVDGGHGFKMLEESEIIEIKQGPYLGDRDKTRFSEPDESKIVLNTK